MAPTRDELNRRIVDAASLAAFITFKSMPRERGYAKTSEFQAIAFIFGMSLLLILEDGLPWQDAYDRVMGQPARDQVKTWVEMLNGVKNKKSAAEIILDGLAKLIAKDIL